MSRKRVLMGLAILAALAGTVAGVLVFLVRHEPEFYRRIGLPPGQESRGLGLIAMRERAELLGGTIEFLRPAGGGTQVRLRVPAPEGAAT